jgi:CBS domain containing-hemolysin-like protein
MDLNGLLFTFPKEIKLLIGSFLVILSIGFYSGLLFVSETSSVNPNGIEENYLGNEDVEDAEIMKFKKSPREMLTTVHSHILSMSLIFFLLGLIVAVTQLNTGLKLFLMLEPFVSVLLTFGGIYFLWNGISWLKYVIMFSGILMTLTFTVSTFIIFSQLFKKK